MPGVINSATELMTPDIWRQLVTSPQTKWLVTKHREVKHSVDDPKWVSDPDYLKYKETMERKKNSKEGKAFAACANDAKRVAMWCQSLKSRLPFVIFIATYPERSVKEGSPAKMWRNQKFAQLNGLVVIDYDHIGSEELRVKSEEFAAADFRQRAAELGILLIFVTPSGDGLKFVIKADPNVGNLIDNQIDFSRKLGLTVDESCKDAARGAFLTTEEDILFINENELFTYENKEFGEKFEEQYRKGDSQPTNSTPESGEVRRGLREASQEDGELFRPPLTPPRSALPLGSAKNLGGEMREPILGGELSYGGWTGELQELLKAYYGETQPGPADKGGNGMSRHTESLKWAYDLLVMTGRNKDRVEKLLRSIPWVDDIVKERGEPVDQTVKDADDRLREREKKYGANVKPSQKMQAAIKALMPEDEQQTGDGLPLEEWGREIEQLFDTFPCLREACQDMKLGGYPAALFTSAAFFGTLMTRTTWHHWFEPEQVRRLNYSIIIIGDPTSGKGFATRLYNLIAAPIKVADKVSTDAINRWKEDKSSKADNKEKPKKPHGIFRNHPARTANGIFIADMVNAVEEVDGEPMNLHLLTFDSELDNATLMGKGGQWIDKTALELKAFHNEEDGQAYANLDSYTGNFNVYWNFVYTGTPLSLDRKVNERNFGTGLATRLAVIPMPDRNFKLAPYGYKRKVDHAADELLKTWAFRLDGVKGELPIEPLVRATYDWQSAKMEVAAYDKDKALDMLLMRVPYYGIGIATPYVLMRHWDEWKEKKTLTLDEYDIRLCTLAMDIQFACQQFFFYAYAQAYFDNMNRDRHEKRRTRASKYDEAYKLLPEEFTIADVKRCYQTENSTARSTCKRLCDDGFVMRIKHGKYKKILSSVFL